MVLIRRMCTRAALHMPCRKSLQQPSCRSVFLHCMFHPQHRHGVSTVKLCHIQQHVKVGCVRARADCLQIQVSSLFVAGWAGLTVNALNLLPTGELDGGRMALGLFGRRLVTHGALDILRCIWLRSTLYSIRQLQGLSCRPASKYWACSEAGKSHLRPCISCSAHCAPGMQCRQ